MGLFKRKRKVKVEVDDASWQPEQEPVEEAHFESEDEKKAYDKDMKQQLPEWQKELKLAKDEYNDVTSHLKDIQQIDKAPDEEKEILLDIADGINKLQTERKRLQKREYQITPSQRKAFDTFASKLGRDTANVKELNEYKQLVKRDLKNLHAERTGLKAEIKLAKHSLNRLNLYAKLVGFFMLIGCGAIILAYQYYEFDYILGFTLVAAAGAGSLAYILFRAGKERDQIKLVERKTNRAIVLNNKIKIKYVNTVNTLDYTFAKYKVLDYEDFEKVRHEYIAQKEEWDRQKETTKLLGDYGRILTTELKKLGLEDTEIWFHQANALCDPKEMVEVRHELNVRRGKLREKIEYNTKLIEEYH